jgi:hypothetical protein
MRDCRISWLVLFALCHASFSFSQCDKGGIDRSSVIDAKKHIIDFAFTHPNDNDQSLRWLLYDEDSKADIPIASVQYDAFPQSSTGRITLAQEPKTTDTYILSVSGLKFKGCTTPVKTTFVRVDTSTSKSIGVKAFPLSGVPTRDSADIYLSGSLNGAKGTHAAYTADEKVQLPIILPDSWFNRKDSAGEATHRSLEMAFLPAFDFKASTNPKADGNSVLIASGFRATFPLTDPAKPGSPDKRLFRDWLPYVGYALEGDKLFSDLNNLMHVTNYFNTRVFGSQVQFTFRPAFGVDVGANTRAPKTGLYSGSIVRPFAGAHVFLNLFTSKTWKRQAFIETDYTRWWPMHSEPNSFMDNSGKLQFSSVGTNPRDNVSTKFEYDFTEYFGFTVQHTYGELPPLFTKVKNQYTLGFVFKAGLQYKPK